MFFHRYTCFALATVVAFSLTHDLRGQQEEPSDDSLAARTSKDVVRFHDAVKVSRHVLRLGDLAVVDLADSDRRAYLSSLVLYSAPIAGATRHIRSRQVHEELLLRNVDLNGIELRGASRISVFRVPNETPTSTVDSTVEKSDVKQATDVADKAGDLVVLLRRSLRRGERVSQFDVEVASSSTAKLRNIDPVRDVKNVIGRELTRSLDAGDAIDRGWVVEPILVKRSAIVSVIVRVGGVQIRTIAKAQQSGTMHDIILLESLNDRRKTLAGRITGIDQVEILAHGSTYEPVREPAGVSTEATGINAARVETASSIRR